MSIFIVEKPDGSCEPINANAMIVENGHLLAKMWSGDSESRAAWAPGAWVSYRERDAEPTIERQMAFTKVLAAAVDALPPGALRDWAEQERIIAEAFGAANERAQAA